MKKLSFLVISILAVFITVIANAGFVPMEENITEYGEAVMSDGNITSVATALMMDTEQDVIMTGHIVDQLGGEEYLFKDATGEMEIEIDDDVWHGLTITSYDDVKIYGEIEPGFLTTKMEVDYIEKM